MDSVEFQAARIVKPEIARDIDALRADLLASGRIEVLVDIAMQPIYRFVSEASNRNELPNDTIREGAKGEPGHCLTRKR